MPGRWRQVFGSLACLLVFDVSARAAEPKEHSELEATVAAPFRAAPAQRRTQARTFVVQLDHRDNASTHSVDWRLTLSGPGPGSGAQGPLQRSWSGRQRLDGGSATVRLHWDGRGNHRRPAPQGLYTLRLVAGSGEDAVEQQWQIAVERGVPDAPRLMAMAPPPALDSTSPYRIVYANLHSQTSHSDGGAALDACKGAQEPQSAPHGPLDAYRYAQEHGLDVLMASEHNHMYDGSDGTNAAARPLDAITLYHDGLAAAAAYTAAHPGFLALYGMEWGVINKGGHLNIFNSDQLLGWERNGQGELLADIDTPKGDYAGLYTLMRERGWLGQFNHPARSGQFLVGGEALGYTPDGDAAMVLCEVMNTSAFSTNDLETENRRSNFEAACNRALAAGYHLAFSSNQDNHCANWGAAYGNRSAILVKRDVPLSRDSVFEALRARRVFATMDKHAQLIFTANGRMMGERFDNLGPLRLAVGFSNARGRQPAAITIFQGVPGANGSVTALSDQARVDFTPAPGPHFYYARVTQDDGNLVWSAPVWVDQLP
ncbi:CehA/McbA family metallohydrolase [Janthinobacterium sp. PC23-8]|uniref:CehA/McbA family metallohydrolase n=1 Tax=Janthinobacterium sp. PC23-8 TaxID=2012679 RepID=UPI000B970416|nr:CehA/McbA family metallohydrolase [Janthinobacterium sp. PC23-8]OYO27719.1 phosphotransferase [Janthinobacterium sp. PC23-8]